MSRVNTANDQPLDNEIDADSVGSGWVWFVLPRDMNQTPTPSSGPRFEGSVGQWIEPQRGAVPRSAGPAVGECRGSLGRQVRRRAQPDRAGNACAWTAGGAAGRR